MKRRTRWLSSIFCRRRNASTLAYLPLGRLKSRQPSPTTSTESRKGQQNPSCIFWNVGGCHPGGLPGLTPESLVLANGNLGPFWQHSCSSNSCDFLILSPFPLSPHFITIWSPDLHRLCQPGPSVNNPEEKTDQCAQCSVGRLRSDNENRCDRSLQFQTKAAVLLPGKEASPSLLKGSTLFPKALCYPVQSWCFKETEATWRSGWQPSTRVAKCHGYDGYIPVKLKHRKRFNFFRIFCGTMAQVIVDNYIYIYIYIFQIIHLQITIWAKF